MTDRRSIFVFTVGALLLLSFAGALAAQEHWVATWASAQQAPRVVRPAPPSTQTTAPQGATAATPVRTPPPPLTIHDQTVRMIARASIGGRRVRVQLSNAFGTAPINIGAAHIALRSQESGIDTNSDRALTFGGQPSGTILAGALLLSDPVDFQVAPLGEMAISVYVRGDAGVPSGHALGLHTTYISGEGDSTSQSTIKDATTSHSWYWLSAVDVLAPADSAAIATFGDSITDGATSTPDTDRSWPSILAQRLAANPATAHIAIINEGISGNRVLGDGAGVSALARFDRDVIAPAGVKWVMILEGINDIGGATGPAARSASANGTATPLTADILIAAYKQMIERAHTHNIQVIGCTLTPYQGAGYASEAGETIRSAFNKWIRTSGAFDAVVDFDQATRDSVSPLQFKAPFNNTDHLHPNDAGYKAMADSVSLSLFTSGRKHKQKIKTD